MTGEVFVEHSLLRFPSCIILDAVYTFVNLFDENYRIKDRHLSSKCTSEGKFNYKIYAMQIFILLSAVRNMVKNNRQEVLYENRIQYLQTTGWALGSTDNDWEKSGWETTVQIFVCSVLPGCKPCKKRFSK